MVKSELELLKDYFRNNIIKTDNNVKLIYHYTDGEGLKGICGGKDIAFRVTDSNFLNDPKELRIAYDICLDRLRKLDIDDKDHILRTISEEFRRIRSHKAYSNQHGGYYVISFSTNPDNILLWGEFSRFYGYNIGFDKDKLLKSLNSDDLIAEGKVIYDKHKQEKLIDKAINDILKPDIKFESDVDYKERVKKLAIAITGYNMLFKDKQFELEEEYRLVFMCVHNCDEIEYNVKQEYRVKDGKILIPYVEEHFIDKTSISSVTIGPLLKGTKAKEGAERFFINEKLEGVHVKESDIDLRY